MPYGHVLLVALAAWITPGAPNHPEGSGDQGDSAPLGNWCSLDDPDAAGLPAALRSLPRIERAIFESPAEPRFLLVRRVEGRASPYDAFSRDEEWLSQFGEFIPVADRIEESAGAQVTIFDCEWNQTTHDSQVSALYAPLADGSTISLWLVTSLASDFDELARELTTVLPHFRQEIAPPAADSYGAILLGHEIHFQLRAQAEGSVPIHLRPVEVPLGEDSEFIDRVSANNPQFDADIIRQWSDDERGISLSFQVIANDMGLGLKEVFVQWLAAQYQTLLREDPEDGDTPVELTHLPNVQTEVVSREEIARHYSNNKRAPEAGVILRVFLPRSPFAEVRELRWSGIDEETGVEEFAWIRFVELRSYRRSRSETILRSSNMLFIARARSRDDLVLLESELRLTSRPLRQAEIYPATQ